MDIFAIILSWVLFGVAASFFASKRGRDPFAWFFIGMLLGIFGILMLFLLSPLETAEEEKVEQATTVQTDQSVDDYQSKEWFYLDEKRTQIGPSPFHVLQKAWTEKQISPRTFVWSEGMEGWKRISEIPNFQNALQPDSSIKK